MFISQFFNQQPYNKVMGKQFFERLNLPKAQNKIIQKVMQEVVVKSVNRSTHDTAHIGDLKRHGVFSPIEMQPLPGLEDALALINSKETGSWVNPEFAIDRNNVLIPPSEKSEFTKEDALLSQFMKQYRLDAKIENGELVFNEGASTFIGLPPIDPVSKEELDAFRRNLAENGLTIDIDWKGVYDDVMNGIGVGFDNAAALNIKIDYLASRYAILSDRIEKDFTDDDKAAQLNILNQTFKTAIETLSITFAQSIGAFYDEFAGSGESEKMYNSLVTGILNRIEEYQSYMTQVGDFSGIIDDSEQWLLRNDAYMAAQLRDSMDSANKSVAESPTSNRSNAEYSLDDLYFAAVSAKEMSSQLESEHSYIAVYSDPQNAGLEFAAQAIKIDKFRQSGNINDKMASLVNKAFNSYMQTLIDGVNQAVKNSISQSAAKGIAITASFDSYQVYEVYNHIMQQYKN